MSMHEYVSLMQNTKEGSTSMEPTQLPDGAASRGMRLFWVQLAFLLLVFVIISLRVYCKVFVVKKTTVDDWLMYLSAALYMPYGIMAMHGVTSGGTGKTVGSYTAEQAAISLRAWYMCEVLYSPITVCARISICLFLLRIAAQKSHRWILMVNIGLISIISVAFFFVMLLQCSPPSFFWEQVLGAEGKCIDPNIVPDATIAHSVISAVSDWIVGLLPVAILWHVKINRRTKATIAVMLSLGLIAGVVILVRIPYLKRLTPSPDFLFETLDIAIWSLLEPAIGIFAGSLPVLRPLFKKWKLGIRTGSKGTGHRHTPSNPSWRSPAKGQSNNTIRKHGVSGSYLADEEGSETELTTTDNTSAGALWDVERGQKETEGRPGNFVYVETRVNVSSHEIDMPSPPPATVTRVSRQDLG